MRPRTGKHPLAVVDAPPVSPPAPPRTLGTAGQDLWARVQAEFVVSRCWGCRAPGAVLRGRRPGAGAFRVRCARGQDAPNQDRVTGASGVARHVERARLYRHPLRRLGVTNEPVARMGRPSGPGWRGNVD